MFKLKNDRFMQKIFRMATLLLLGMFSSVAVFGQSKYDLNGDGSVNVGDVTELVGVVLGGGGGSGAEGAQTIKVGSVEFKMLPVSGGTFQMGSPASDTDAWDDDTDRAAAKRPDIRPDFCITSLCIIPLVMLQK